MSAFGATTTPQLQRDQIICVQIISESVNENIFETSQVKTDQQRI